MGGRSQILCESRVVCFTFGACCEAGGMPGDGCDKTRDGVWYDMDMCVQHLNKHGGHSSGQRLADGSGFRDRNVSIPSLLQTKYEVCDKTAALTGWNERTSFLLTSTSVAQFWNISPPRPHPSQFLLVLSL